MNRGEAVAASAYGAPPALLTTTSSRPCSATMPSTIAVTASGSRTSHGRCVVPGAADSTAERAQVTTVAPGLDQHLRDARADALAAAR